MPHYSQVVWVSAEGPKKSRVSTQMTGERIKKNMLQISQSFESRNIHIRSYPLCFGMWHEASEFIP